jgi:CubicO group peptidase (beta-lactamase class C family)
MLRHAGLASALALAASAAAAAAEPPLVTPEVADAVKTAMHTFVDEGNAPGLITYIVENGEVALADAYGVANIETKAPMQVDTLIRIASLSKLITSIAALQLYEQGKLGLDEPVATYIPEFADLKVALEDGTLVEPEHPPTIRELMSHTAGFSYGLGRSHPADVAYSEANVIDYSTSLDVMIGKLARIPLKHQPGTRFEYSVGTDILGAVIQRVSGQPFDEYLREHIFTPLDMPDTDFYVHPDAVDRMAALHGRGQDGTVSILRSSAFGDPSVDPTKMPGLPSGGGGIWSTVEDYSHFLMMLDNGGTYEDRQIVKPETVELFLTNQMPPNGEGRISVAVYNTKFGLGTAITAPPAESGQSMPENSVSWPGIYGVYWWLDQDRDLIVFAAAQLIGVRSPGEVAGKTLYTAADEPAGLVPEGANPVRPGSILNQD